ncbi:MAG: uracil-DNA glycosylase family protein [Gammaproteobacteria bacterium]|nr:MAG: uracil-DNA glycosylase family protein [Gammaproteobacteria bacterium]
MRLPLVNLLAEVRACRACTDLPLGPRPVLQAAQASRILIVGQAPGARVHATGIPWNDPSGDTLRRWLEVDRSQFYDASCFAIIPMGLCYPGRGRSGDLPPRPECAPRWHPPLLEDLEHIKLTLLIGRFAQERYLGADPGGVSPRVESFQTHLEAGYMPLPHPSPRNRRWLRERPWFEQLVVPELRRQVHAVLDD